jgi:hypothetical protein
MIRPIASIVAIALAVVSASQAIAAPRDPDVPRPDPPGRWRVLDHTDAKSTSKCIGKPVTPLCAVETLRACFLRVKPKLCEIAIGREPGFSLSHPAVRWVFDKYRLVWSQRLDEHEIDALKQRWRRPALWDYAGVKPGDIAIELLVLNCQRKKSGTRCFRDRYSQEIYIAQRTNGEWHVPPY